MQLYDQIRRVIAEQGEFGLLVMADQLDDAGDATLAELFRTYVEIQTMIRMSQPIPHEMGVRFAELQSKFNTQPYKSIASYGGQYSNPLGVYYTGLRCRQNDLIADIDLLSREPVRTLELLECYPSTDLEIILRNYRIDSMYQISLTFNWRRTSNATDLGKAILAMEAGFLREFRINRVNDRLNMIPAHFLSNKKIASGCKLLMGTRLVATRK